MAVDYGDAHTGLACCDRTQTLASPIGVIDERNFQTCVEKVAAAAVEYEVGEVVVGNPINMNGTYGPRSEKCRMFADMLQNFLEIPRLQLSKDISLSQSTMTLQTPTRNLLYHRRRQRR